MWRETWIRDIVLFWFRLVNSVVTYNISEANLSGKINFKFAFYYLLVLALKITILGYNARRLS